MAVQVWIGEKPEHPNERRAIVALANGLERLEGLYLILANFSVGGSNIDLVIIKPDGVFIIELKHCDGKVFGGVNGPWFVASANGERKRLNPGRKNPYNQVIAYFHALTNFLNEHRREFLSPQKSTSVDFRTCRRVVVIAPAIQEGSDIQLDWKVELRGLDTLPAFLVTERSSEINLTDEEMLKIPELLHCTQWREINSLIAGVMPKPEEVSEQSLASSAAPPATAQPAQASPPESESQASSLQSAILHKIRAALRTTTGRIAAAMSALALVLCAILIFRPPRVVVPPIDQPSLVYATSEPAGGTFAASTRAGAERCVWSGLLPVGKRWDSRSQGWVSVDVDGTATQLPDVIVTLEQVAYCSDQITLTWSVRNASRQAVAFPLHSDNISIRDLLGNEYVVSNGDSEPGEMRVPPGAEGRGTVVVKRPLSQSASSLLVRLRDKPFGEASWLVSLDGK